MSKPVKNVLDTHLTPARIARIKHIQQRIEAGESLQDVADDLGISSQRVSQLLRPRVDRAKVRALLGVDEVLTKRLQEGRVSRRHAEQYERNHKVNTLEDELQ